MPFWSGIFLAIFQGCASLIIPKMLDFYSRFTYNEFKISQQKDELIANRELAMAEQPLYKIEPLR